MVPSLEVFYVFKEVISTTISGHVGHLNFIREWSYHDF